jgi:hypothetical protein
MGKTLLSAVRRCLRLLPTSAAVVGALAGAAGCRHADLAEQGLALRGARMARTAKLVVQQEQSRPRRLAYALNEVHRGLQRDAEMSRANIDEIKLYWQSEWQQWRECEPVYRDRVNRVLRGKPERIEPNAIILFL